MVQHNGRRRVAIYCRVSTSDQDNDRQERDLMEHAELAGYKVVGVFKETLSGIRQAKGKQPLERKKVMALAQRREIDAVLVRMLIKQIVAPISCRHPHGAPEVPRRDRRRPGGQRSNRPDRRRRSMNLNDQIHRAAQRSTDSELYAALETLKAHLSYREELKEHAAQGGRLSRPAWASRGKKRGGHVS